MKSLKKKLYIAFGFLAVILAIVGVFIPGLPTVPFLLVLYFVLRDHLKNIMI